MTFFASQFPLIADFFPAFNCAPMYLSVLFGRLLPNNNILRS
jgi:hypothetical protein